MKNTNISIVQLIKVGDFNVDFEISNIRAGKDINISIKNYLKKSLDYQSIREQIQKSESDLKNASISEKLYYSEKLQNILKIQQDFIVNTLLLAGAFSTLDIRTERLRKAIELFESGKIVEADLILNEEDLLNDQANLIPFAIYLEKKINR
jgi:hypothetical protein